MNKQLLPNYYVRTCKLCGGNAEVIESRERENGIMYRRRRCLNCENRITTVEIDKELFEAMLDVSRQLLPHIDSLTKSVEALNYVADNSIKIDDAINQRYGLEPVIPEKLARKKQGVL